MPRARATGATQPTVLPRPDIDALRAVSREYADIGLEMLPALGRVDAFGMRRSNNP